MSVTGTIDGRYVEYDVTFGDWSRLCRWLGQRSTDPVLDAFASMCMTNLDVAGEDAQAAIALARTLNPPEDLDIIINTIEHNVLDTASHFTDDDVEDDDLEPE